MLPKEMLPQCLSSTVVFFVFIDVKIKDDSSADSTGVLSL